MTATPVDYRKKTKRPYTPAVTRCAPQSYANSNHKRGASLEAIFRTAVELQRQGQFADAAALYEAILQTVTGHVGALHNLGMLRIQDGQTEEAANLFRLSIVQNPTSVISHLALADLLAASDLPQDAIGHYETALALNPDSIEANNNFANLLKKLGRYEDALGYYSKIAALRPDSAVIQNNLGANLEKLGRFDEALACYERAATLNPNFTTAHENRAKLLEQLGHIQRAEEAFKAAIRAKPRNAHAYLGLSVVKRFQHGDMEIDAMQALDAVADLSLLDRTELQFALGKAFFDLGDPKSSLRYFSRGNTLKRGQIAYDEQATLTTFDAIAQAYPAGSLNDTGPRGNLSAVPIFVLGMPRSGTTLVEQILSSHPQISAAGETGDFQRCGMEIGVDARTAEHLDRLGENYIRALTAHAPGAQRITDKTNNNFLFAGLIYATLPNARIIHVRRNPVDTCLSCYSRLFVEGQHYSYDLSELGRYYRAYDRLMAHWRKVLPEGAMVEIDYEELVTNFDAQARRLVAACGLERSDSCRTFYKSRRFVLTASVAQVRQPLYRSAIDSSRNYRKYLRPLLDALGDLAGA